MYVFRPAGMVIAFRRTSRPSLSPLTAIGRWTFCLRSIAVALKPRQAGAQAGQGELAVRVGQGRFATRTVLVGRLDRRVGHRPAVDIEHGARQLVARCEDDTQTFLSLVLRELVNIILSTIDVGGVGEEDDPLDRPFAEEVSRPQRVTEDLE